MRRLGGFSSLFLALCIGPFGAGDVGAAPPRGARKPRPLGAAYAKSPARSTPRAATATRATAAAPATRAEARLEKARAAAGELEQAATRADQELSEARAALTSAKAVAARAAESASSARSRATRGGREVSEARSRLPHAVDERRRAEADLAGARAELAGAAAEHETADARAARSALRARSSERALASARAAASDAAEQATAAELDAAAAREVLAGLQETDRKRSTAPVRGAIDSLLGRKSARARAIRDAAEVAQAAEAHSVAQRGAARGAREAMIEAQRRAAAHDSAAAAARRDAAAASSRVAEIEAELAAAERRAARATTEVEGLERTIALGEADAAAAAREAGDADRASAEAAGRLAKAAAREQAAERAAERAESSLARAKADLLSLADASTRAAERRAAGRARLDQHRASLAAGGKQARETYRRAARRAGLRSFIESKPGEISQDALAAAPELGRYAIADGVTRSDFSGELARALVRRWTAEPPATRDGFRGWLSGAQEDWSAEIAPRVTATGGAWYNRNRSWKGHAAFVGARLIAAKGGGQKLVLSGTGDTVAFLVRDGAIARSFPLERAGDFSDVVRALPSDGEPPFPVRHQMWTVKPGDEVFMATDALAAWMLAEVEAGRDPFALLRDIRSQRQMSQFVTAAREGALRGRGVLDVDDTAFLHFRIRPPLAGAE